MVRKFFTLFFIICFLGFTFSTAWSAADDEPYTPENPFEEPPDTSGTALFAFGLLVIVGIVWWVDSWDRDFHPNDYFKTQTKKGFSISFDIADIDNASNRFGDDEGLISPNLKVVYSW